MQIAHIGIFTRQLEEMRTFYETYFHLTAGEKYCSNDEEAFESYFLPLGQQTSLELMTRRILSEKSAGYAVGYVHFAISLGSRENVDAYTAAIAAAGYPVLSAPRTTGDGYYESKIADPDGNEVELTI